MTVIIDYGAGNTASLANAVRDITSDVIISGDKDIIKKAERVILPGVGEASAAMNNLAESGIKELLKELDVPFLGICLGMQLMGSYSEEGNTECLGLAEFTVQRFTDPGLIVPHMGWSRVNIDEGVKIFKDVPQSSYFYFAHSYFVPAIQHTVAKVEHGNDFSAAIEVGLRYGIQFHPEKSGEFGIQILRNFLTI